MIGVHPFFGEWLLQVQDVAGHMAQSLVLAGTDALDGRHPVSYAERPTLSVTGAAWHLALEHFPFDEGADWRPSDVRAATSYDPAVGLVHVLEAASVPPGTVHDRYDHLVVRLTSRDPDLLVPDLEPNPYDFTIPERHG